MAGGCGTDLGVAFAFGYWSALSIRDEGRAPYELVTEDLQKSCSRAKGLANRSRAFAGQKSAFSLRCKGQPEKRHRPPSAAGTSIACAFFGFCCAWDSPLMPTEIVQHKGR